MISNGPYKTGVQIAVESYTRCGEILDFLRSVDGAVVNVDESRSFVTRDDDDRMVPY